MMSDGYQYDIYCIMDNKSDIRVHVGKFKNKTEAVDNAMNYILKCLPSTASWTTMCQICQTMTNLELYHIDSSNDYVGRTVWIERFSTDLTRYTYKLYVDGDLDDHDVAPIYNSQELCFHDMLDYAVRRVILKDKTYMYQYLLAYSRTGNSPNKIIRSLNSEARNINLNIKTDEIIITAAQITFRFVIEEV